MNKYQEAVDYVNKSVCTALDFLGVEDKKTHEYLHILQEAVNKAQKYDQLTEQLGCPIEVVLEALENGVYVEDYDGELLPILRDWHNCTKNTGAFGFLDKRVFNKYAFYKWKDYKKTWWTKEDKSE